MENNRICNVIVDHFKIKKGAICHISVIFDAEIIRLFTQSVQHIENTITRFSWLPWQANWNKTSLFENK